MRLGDSLAAAELGSRATEPKGAAADVERAICRGGICRAPASWITLGFVVTVCCAIAGAAKGWASSADEAVSSKCVSLVNESHERQTHALVDKPPFPQQPILHGLLAEQGIV